MNGRVYDPKLGRFLSVDPVFQFPTNTQSLNPYSYVMNSPLSATDPTGLVENEIKASGTDADDPTGGGKTGGDTGTDNTGNSNKGDARSKFFANANAKFSRDLVNDAGETTARRNLASGNADWQSTKGPDSIGAPASRSADRKGEPPADTISDIVDRNLSLGNDKVRMEKNASGGTTTTVDVSASAGPGISDTVMSKAETEIENDLSKSWKVGDKEFKMVVNIRVIDRHSIVGDSYADIVFEACGANGSCAGGAQGEAAVGGTSVYLNPRRMGPQTPAHEFLHVLGVQHAPNKTKSLRSYYDKGPRSLKYEDYCIIANAYGSSGC